MVTLKNIANGFYKLITPTHDSWQTFIKGTDLITTSLILMKKTPLQDLDFALLPIKSEPVRLYLAWHQRDHDDPAHQWLRKRIKNTVSVIFTD